MSATMNVQTASEEVAGGRTLHDILDASKDTCMRIDGLVSQIETSLRGPVPCDTPDQPVSAGLMPRAQSLWDDLNKVENRIQRILTDLQVAD